MTVQQLKSLVPECGSEIIRFRQLRSYPGANKVRLDADDYGKFDHRNKSTVKVITHWNMDLLAGAAACMYMFVTKLQ